jgi:hypothetical protein
MEESCEDFCYYIMKYGVAFIHKLWRVAVTFVLEIFADGVMRSCVNLFLMD